MDAASLRELHPEALGPRCICLASRLFERLLAWRDHLRGGRLISGAALRAAPETQDSGVDPRSEPSTFDVGGASAALLGAVKGKLAPRFALRWSPSATLDCACEARPGAWMPAAMGGWR